MSYIEEQPKTSFFGYIKDTFEGAVNRITKNPFVFSSSTNDLEQENNEVNKKALLLNVSKEYNTKLLSEVWKSIMKEMREKKIPFPYQYHKIIKMILYLRGLQNIKDSTYYKDFKISIGMNQSIIHNLLELVDNKIPENSLYLIRDAIQLKKTIETLNGLSGAPEIAYSLTNFSFYQFTYMLLNPFMYEDADNTHLLECIAAYIIYRNGNVVKNQDIIISTSSLTTYEKKLLFEQRIFYTEVFDMNKKIMLSDEIKKFGEFIQNVVLLIQKDILFIYSEILNAIRNKSNSLLPEILINNVRLLEHQNTLINVTSLYSTLSFSIRKDAYNLLSTENNSELKSRYQNLNKINKEKINTFIDNNISIPHRFNVLILQWFKKEAKEIENIEHLNIFFTNIINLCIFMNYYAKKSLKILWVHEKLPKGYDNTTSLFSIWENNESISNLRLSENKEESLSLLTQTDMFTKIIKERKSTYEETFLILLKNTLSLDENNSTSYIMGFVTSEIIIDGLESNTDKKYVHSFQLNEDVAAIQLILDEKLYVIYLFNEIGHEKNGLDKDTLNKLTYVPDRKFKGNDENIIFISVSDYVIYYKENAAELYSEENRLKWLKIYKYPYLLWIVDMLSHGISEYTISRLLLTHGTNLLNYISNKYIVQKLEKIKM